MGSRGSRLAAAEEDSEEVTVMPGGAPSRGSSSVLRVGGEAPWETVQCLGNAAGPTGDKLLGGEAAADARAVLVVLPGVCVCVPLLPGRMDAMAC